jgi:hypothetical protein
MKGFVAAPLVPVERSGALPLSFAQERLWFFEQLQPGTVAYNIVMSRKRIKAQAAARW